MLAPAIVIQRSTRSRGLTFVVIRFTVAAANRLVIFLAGLGHRAACTLRVGSLALAWSHFAILLAKT